MRQLSRGDTIIEVLLATTIFSLVSVGAMTVMNQGTNTAQRSLEVTHVRQQIDAQAEALRAAHQAASRGANTSWNIMKSKPVITGFYADAANNEKCPSKTGGATRSVPGGAFIMNTEDAGVEDLGANFKYVDGVMPIPYANVVINPAQTPRVTSYGIWVEHQAGTAGVGNIPNMQTFVINACWYGPGLDVPMKLDTTVRLYDVS